MPNLTPIPSVSAIIVSFNSASVLAACLQALKGEGVTAIVVDNASTDESVAIAKAEGAEVIESEINLGFGRGMNLGVKQVKSEFCLLINPDATVQHGCIHALLEAAKAHPEAVILAPKITEPDGRVFEHKSILSSCSPLTGQQARASVNAAQAVGGKFPPTLQTWFHSFSAAPPLGGSELLIVSGACMLIRREWFEREGGFDQKIFLFYEDDDLCRRAWESGHEVRYVPEANVLHLRGKSVAPSLAHIYTVRYHQAFSRGYICRKYSIAHHPLRLIATHALKLIPAILSFNRKKITRQRGSICGNLAILRLK